MTVRVRSLQGGKSLRLAFSDNFNRADSDSLGENWLTACWHESGGAGADAAADAIVASGECKIRNIGADNPVGLYKMAFVPLPVYVNLQHRPKTFVQITWQSGVAATAFLAGFGLRYNTTLQNGVGVNIADMYGLFFNQLGNVGDLARITGAGQTTLITQAAFASTLVAGDTCRMNAEDTGASIILTVFKNGVQIGTITDSAGNRILLGSPVMAHFDTAGIGVKSMNFDNFSCGIF